MMFGVGEGPRTASPTSLRLRELQDETGGFTAFICWPFQSAEHPARAGRRQRPRLPAHATPWRGWCSTTSRTSRPPGSPWAAGVAQAALHMGCNDFGQVMIEENVVSAAGTTFKMDSEEVERHIRDAGFRAARRNMRYQLVGGGVGVSTRVLSAPWVLTGDPAAADAIADGAIALDGDRVLAVGPRAEVEARFGPAERLDAVILPALVNAHLHLELSHMQGWVTGGEGLPAWIQLFIASRRRTREGEPEQAMLMAAEDLVRAGVAAVGDVTNTLDSLRAARRGRPGRDALPRGLRLQPSTASRPPVPPPAPPAIRPGRRRPGLRVVRRARTPSTPPAPSRSARSSGPAPARSTWPRTPPSGPSAPTESAAPSAGCTASLGARFGALRASGRSAVAAVARRAPPAPPRRPLRGPRRRGRPAAGRERRHGGALPALEPVHRRAAPAPRGAARRRGSRSPSAPTRSPPRPRSRRSPSWPCSTASSRPSPPRASSRSPGTAPRWARRTWAASRPGARPACWRRRSTARRWRTPSSGSSRPSAPRSGPSRGSRRQRPEVSA